MEWGKSKSKAWLKSFCLSWLEELFLTDPIKVLVLALFAATMMWQRKKKEMSNPG